jgi:hypothetical protein
MLELALDTSNQVAAGDGLPGCLDGLADTLP